MSNKLTYDYVKQYIESFNYKLIDTIYKNNNDKLNLMCPKNHEFKIRYGHFQQGKRCPICKKWKYKKKTYDYVKNYIESFGYKLLSTEYKNEKSKLQLQCSKNHIYLSNYNDFQQNHRCPICIGNIKYKYDYVKNYIESFGYKLLSTEYSNNKEIISLKCDEGHIYNTSFHCFEQGRRCFKCSNNKSTPEKGITKFIQQIYNGIVIENDRKQLINPLTNRHLELDIWLPELNKAIEYNGEYWHRNKKYIDKIKQEQCINRGIQLLVIEDKKWNRSFETIKNFVLDGGV